MTEDHVKLLKEILTIVGIVFTCVGSYFIHSHTLTAIALYSVVASNATFYTFLHLRHVYRKQTAFSRPIGITYAGIVGILVLAAVLLYNNPFEDVVQRVYFTNLNEIVPAGEADQQHYLPFFVVAQRPNKLLGYPVSLLIDVAVGSDQLDQSPILQFSLQSSKNKNGPWSYLCPLNVSENTLVASMTGIDGIQVNTYNFFDNNLINQTMKAGQTITGWSAWGCPGKCHLQFLRMIAVDAAGHRSVGLLESQAIHDMASRPSSSMKMLGPVDLRGVAMQVPNAVCH